MNYDELAAFASSMPHIPKRELRCHPSVTVALRTQGDTERYSTWVNTFGDGRPSTDLLEMPIHEDRSLEFGEWRIIKDGVVVASGNLLDLA